MHVLFIFILSHVLSAAPMWSAKPIILQSGHKDWNVMKAIPERFARKHTLPTRHRARLNAYSSIDPKPSQLDKRMVFVADFERYCRRGCCTARTIKLMKPDVGVANGGMS
jgi:hypothetical protein